MDFFAHQEAARRRTSLLLFYYALAVVFLVLATYTAALLVFSTQGESFGAKEVPYWHPQIFLYTTVGTLGVIALGSLWRTIELRRGGSAVAQMLGGVPVPPEPADAAQRTLRNVVEEMAIASGTPVPELFILPEERGINAFAAGNSTADAAVGVTRGCIQRLSRDELQGVIAHEYSHILNGDMRMNLRLMGVLHGILCIYIIGRILLRVRASSSSLNARSDKKGANPLPLFGLLLIIIGSLGVLFGRLIQAAVSRQREFLADAAAVQFTRNPGGISGALKKIGGAAMGSRIVSPQASSASHMFFGNALSEAWFGLTATHPPLRERIKRIEPNFDGTFPVTDPDELPPEFAERRAQFASMHTSALARSPEVSAPQVMQHVGETVSVEFAAGLVGALPHELRVATANSLHATALMFALVMSHDATMRTQQFALIANVHGDVARLAAHYAERLATLDRRVRLLLLNLSLPALRTLSEEQWAQFRSVLDHVVRCDQQVELFEFVLKRITERAVDAHFEPRRATVVQFYSFNGVARDCQLLLSALAHVGAADSAAVQRAFAEGAARLPLNLGLLPAAECAVDRIDIALDRLAHAVPHIKKSFLNASAHTVSCDGLVRAEEAELLRAIAESLDCPIPPFVTGV